MCNLTLESTPGLIVFFKARIVHCLANLQRLKAEEDFLFEVFTGTMLVPCCDEDFHSGRVRRGSIRVDT